MKRKIFLAVVSCLVVFTISVGATYAWLTNATPAEQAPILILGENDILLVEDFEPPAVMTPNSTFVKRPWAVNQGNLPTFVRARVEFSNLEGYNISELRTDGAAGTHNDWVFNPASGYFYYNRVLHPGQSSAPIFTHVHILQNRPGGAALQLVDMVDFDIIVYIESRNHLDNPACQVGFAATNPPCTCPGNMWQDVWNS